MGVKCLAQENNTMIPIKVETRTTQSGVQRTSHLYDIASSTGYNIMLKKSTPFKALNRGEKKIKQIVTSSFNICHPFCKFSSQNPERKTCFRSIEDSDSNSVISRHVFGPTVRSDTYKYYLALLQVD